MKNAKLLLAVGVAIICGFGAATPALAHRQVPRDNHPAGDMFDGELDQAQTKPQGPPLAIGAVLFNDTLQQNLTATQSFTPSKDVVSRALLLMARNASTTKNCTCDIRDNLTGATLGSVVLTPDLFNVYNSTNATGNLTWVEFDFYSIWITPGTTYYLVVYTENVTDNLYYWAANDSDPYQNGSAYSSVDNGQSWQNLTNNDTCFQIYGARETKLSITIGKGLFGPLFTVRNTGNHTAGGIISNTTVKGGILGLVHIINYNFYDSLPQNNQRYIFSPLALGFGPVTITETVWAINAKPQVVQVNATLIIIFMTYK